MGKAGGRAMQNILNYMTQQYSEVIDLYTKARAAKIKFWHNTDDHRFTDDERDSLIMLASAFSAILRRTYRLFVTEQGLEPTAFWDAYIRFAVFRQNVLFNKDWKKVFKLDKELHRLIKKTSNSDFIEKIFTGDISLKWLIRELGGENLGT